MMIIFPDEGRRWVRERDEVYKSRWQIGFKVEDLTSDYLIVIVSVWPLHLPSSDPKS